MRRSLRRRRALLIVGMCFGLTLGAGAAPARAQLDTGAVTGVVTDESGAVLPGVTITVTNLATRQDRIVVTNERGGYLVPALQPGRYSVTAELQGFATIVRPEITVNVGATVAVNLVMTVAAVKETVTVTGEAPLVERTRTDLSNLVTQEYLQALPNKRYDYLDFVLLMPASTERMTGQQGTGAVVGGAGSKEGMVLVDGFYNMDEGFSNTKVRHSQDSVQEFQVVGFGGSAEHGRAIGGIINVVTKSGGNEFKGTGYGFFRDTRLNSQDFGEKRRGTPKSEYDRQQWGGTLGGPVKRDTSFFMAAFERVSEDWPFDNGIRPQDGVVIGLPSADVGTVPRFYRQTFAFGKWDHNLSGNNRLQFTYTYHSAIDWQTRTFRPLATRSATYGTFPSDHVFVGKWTGIASDGRKLQELKLAYFPRKTGARGRPLGGPPLVPDGQINLGPATNASPPRVTIASVATFGSTILNNAINTYPVQVIYTSSRFTERHNVKFGADYMYSYYDYNQYNPFAGAYSFASLQNFVRGVYSTYTQAFGDAANPRTHQYFSAFVQDSWDAHDRLTINYGVRYDLELNPEQKRSGIPFGNDYNNVGPRFALSYDLTDQGTTFVKLASGVYYDRVFGNAHNNLYNLKDHELRVSATWRPQDPGAPVYPNVFATKPANLPHAVIDVIVMPDKVNVPTTAQVVGMLERALTPNLVVSTSAIYTRSWSKDYTWDTNLVWDGQRWVRPDPNYRRITQLRYGAPAEYAAWIAEVERRGSVVGFTGNLTVSRAYGVVPGTINDQRDGVKGDWGPNSDVPTVRVVSSGWYNINKYLQISGVFRARTGMAINPVAAGLDLNGDSVFGDRTPGLAPYSFRAPAMNSVDARITWRVPLKGEKALQLYFEGFNLLNRENVLTVLNDYGPDPANPRPRWMEPSSFFAPRELQMGARLVF